MGTDEWTAGFLKTSCAKHQKAMNINPLVFFLMQIRPHGFWSLLKRSIFGVYHSVSAITDLRAVDFTFCMKHNFIILPRRHAPLSFVPSPPLDSINFMASS